MGVAGVSLFNITTDLTKGGTPSALVVKGTYAVLCVALVTTMEARNADNSSI